MKIEQGKFYKTREGRKALVVGELDKSLGNCGDFAVQVECCVFRYQADGKWLPTPDDNPNDLVAEWQEPVSRPVWLHLIRYSNGRTNVLTFDEPEPPDCFGGKLIARKPITITEGEGI